MSAKVLAGDQVVLLAVVVFTGIVTAQPVGQLRGEKGGRGLRGGFGGPGGVGRLNRRGGPF